MLKRLRDNIYARKWPAYIEKPLVSLVYLVAVALALILLGLCCAVVMGLSPVVRSWFH